ncbi:unnamed protein product, partial [Prorocentrum cordatum]
FFYDAIMSGFTSGPLTQHASRAQRVRTVCVARRRSALPHATQRARRARPACSAVSGPRGAPHLSVRWACCVRRSIGAATASDVPRGGPRPPRGRGLDFQGRRPDKDQGAACLGRHRRLRRGTAAASAVRHAAPAPTPRGPRGGGPRICSRLPLQRLPPSPGRPCLVPAASSFALLGLPRVVFRPLGRPSRVQVVATACPRRFCLQPSWSESVGGARVGGSTASSVRSPGRPGGVLGPLGRPHPVQVVATAGPRRFWLRPSRNEDVGGARVGGSAASRSARASGGRAAVARGCPLLHALGRPQRGRALQPPPAVPSLARQPCPHRQADCRCPGAREETTGRHAVPLAAPLPPWRPDGGTPFSAGPRSSGSSALLAALPPHDYISAGVAGLARCESGTSPASE